VTYWPGTNVVKSQNNAFDLRACPGALAAMARDIEVKAAAGLKGAQAQQAAKTGKK
jgi:hypothetical protein